MTALDLSALSPEVTILGATTIVGPSAAVSSTPVTGFSDVATATIVVKVERVDNSNGEALSVTVQQSDDGDAWTTAAGPYSFTREGTQTLAVDSPSDRLRVTYAAARGVREATIGSITARLGVVDAPGSGGGALLTVTVPVTAAEIIAMSDTPKVLVAAPDSDTLLLPTAAVLTFRAGTVAYDYDPELRVTWSEYQTSYLGRTIAVLNVLDDHTYVWILAAFEWFTDDADPTASPQGQALVLTAPGVLFSEPLGDGTVDVTVYYHVVSLT